VSLLNIKGSFAPDDASCGQPSAQVAVDKLEICCLKICGNRSLQYFISGFRNLRRIALRTDRSETLPLDEITCDRLEELELSGWCVTESSLVELINRHKSPFSLDIVGVTLVSGTWGMILAQAHAAKVSLTLSLGHDPGSGSDAVALLPALPARELSAMNIYI
jgi:hypothetical protein